MSNQVYIFDMDGVLREREGSNGGRSVANVGVLPVPMLPISNWGLELAHAEVWRGENRFGILLGERKNRWNLMEKFPMARIGIMQVVVASLVAFAEMGTMAEVKDGTTFRLGTVPTELVAERRMGDPVLFSLEENASTGFKWEVESNTNECTVVLKHRGGDKGATCGAPGLLDVTVTSLVRTPVRVEFRYRRPWEKDVEPWKTLRLVVNTVSGEKQTPLTK